MRLWRAFLALLVLGIALPVQAHRLDEYLQATTLAVDRNQVTLTMRMTAGVSAAPAVLALIDANHDGTLSDAEQQTYVEQVRQDLTLTLDGKPALLRAGASSFPRPADVKAGLGDILMVFSADVPPGGGRHRLSLINRHQSRIAVYLVNALQPTDPAIQILSQTRNGNQSSYGLDFSSGAASAVLPGVKQPGPWPVMATFFWRGVAHILTGYDHLLFVAALVLGAASLWDLVKVVTAFTVAHSLTLALATFGLVRLPPSVVEPLIAASIVFVAVQNIVWPSRAQGGSRLAVAFVFGLAHGLGFASGLLDIMHQMPTATVILSLLGFSLGIEAGNQLVLLPLFGAMTLIRRARSDDLGRGRFALKIQQFASAGIALAGAYFLGVALIASG